MLFKALIATKIVCRRAWYVCFQAPTWMGMYGAPTPKFTMLRGNAPYLGELSRRLDLDDERYQFDSTGVTEVKLGSDGSTHVNGGSRLKGTQEYPW
eukprot:7602611-Alexandrium_andersonii.AAC.1